MPICSRTKGIPGYSEAKQKSENSEYKRNKKRQNRDKTGIGGARPSSMTSQNALPNFTKAGSLYDVLSVVSDPIGQLWLLDQKVQRFLPTLWPATFCALPILSVWSALTTDPPTYCWRRKNFQSCSASSTWVIKCRMRPWPTQLMP